MLKVQHIPWSVGRAVKMAEQGIWTPFHSQYRKIELPPSLFAPFPSDVMSMMSKQGDGAYQKAESNDSNAAVCGQYNKIFYACWVINLTLMAQAYFIIIGQPKLQLVNFSVQTVKCHF